MIKNISCELPPDLPGLQKTLTSIAFPGYIAIYYRSGISFGMIGIKNNNERK